MFKKIVLIIVTLLILVSCNLEFTLSNNPSRVGLADPSFEYISDNLIPYYKKGPMNSVWQSEGIDREGYNYYFFPKAQSNCINSERFNPSSIYFQSWFGMYTISDNSDGIYALNNQELNEYEILKLAIADQNHWLRNFAGIGTPSVYLDSTIEIVKERIMIDSTEGWKISGRLISNVDVGSNNKTFFNLLVNDGNGNLYDVSEVVNVDINCWEGYVSSYQKVFLDAFAYVWYSQENLELNVGYFNGIEYLSKDGDTYKTIDLIYSELEEMVLNITVYE